MFNKKNHHYIMNDCEDVCNQCEDSYLGKAKTCKGCDKKICKHCYYSKGKTLCKECDKKYITQMKEILYNNH